MKFFSVRSESDEFYKS